MEGKNRKCVISLSVLSITVLRQANFLASITMKAFGQWSDPGRLSLAEAVNGSNGILNLLCGDPLKVQVPISERVIRLISQETVINNPAEIWALPRWRAICSMDGYHPQIQQV